MSVFFIGPSRFPDIKPHCPRLFQPARATAKRGAVQGAAGWRNCIYACRPAWNNRAFIRFLLLLSHATVMVAASVDERNPR